MRRARSRKAAGGDIGSPEAPGWVVMAQREYVREHYHEWRLVSCAKLEDKGNVAPFFVRVERPQKLVTSQGWLAAYLRIRIKYALITSKLVWYLPSFIELHYYPILHIFANVWRCLGKFWMRKMQISREADVMRPQQRMGSSAIGYILYFWVWTCAA